MENAKQKPDELEASELPEPGPLNIITDTGFGPLGTFDEEPLNGGNNPTSRILGWLSRRGPRKEAENLKAST